MILAARRATLGAQGVRVPPSRRQILAASVVAALPAVAGLHAWSWYDRPAGEGLLVLSDEEHTFAQALAEAWMPPGGDPAISGAEAGMGRFLDEVVASMTVQQGKLFRLLLHLLDEETVPTRLARFSSLPLADRTDVLRGWMDSPWFAQRQAVGAVLALISFGYTEHPAVAERVRPLFRCGFGA